jgi:hypothetical protein
MTGAAFAIPFASQIRVSDTAPPEGAGMTITYYINEAGGTATIDIIKVSDLSGVASFTGTATLGKNTVVWDGTVDNAGGADVPVGNYRVKITVAATKSVGWAEVASNSSPLGGATPATTYATLWNGFSGMEMVIPANQDKDSFGYILCSTGANVDPRNHGHVVFNPDLSCTDGGDGQNMWMKYPGTPLDVDYTLCWGNCSDPDNADYIWVAGQSFAPQTCPVMFGKYNDVTATDVTNSITTLDGARDIAVCNEGATKYAYVAQGTNVLFKVTISGNLLTGTPTDIVECVNTGMYSKGVDVDSDGNLYWSVRRDTALTPSGTGGRIFRWSAATIASATAGSLNEANSDWDIQFPVGALHVEGVGISPSGDVYGIACNDSDGSIRGIYLLGNKSLTPNKKTLTTGDRIIPFTDYYWSTYGCSAQFDYAGNLIAVNRQNEEIRAYTPGGSSNVAITAPASQNFEVAAPPPPPLAARNWELYE